MPFSNKTTELCDEIRMKGIRAKGYGQVAKMAMLDPDLSIEAKGILAYFCSYCGGGNTAFPGRDKIVYDLKVNKDTYYKHLKSLISNGYISVEQKAGDKNHPGFKHNIYTIENFPEKYTEDIPDSASEHMRDSYEKVKSVKDITAAGYGIVPKIVMTDDISVQAKGLYAYLCSFSGQDFSAAPSKDIILTHLNISHNSSNKYMKELCEHDYVRKVQAVTNGRFAGFVYYLNQLPGEEVSEPNISDTRGCAPQPNISDTQVSVSEPNISDTDILCSETKFSDTQLISRTSFSDTQKSDTSNRDINIPSTNTTKNNINFSYNQSILSTVETCTQSNDDEWIDFENKKDDILDEIISAKTIPYSYLSSPVKINAALKILTEWDIRSKPNYYMPGNGSLCVQVYKNFISALSEMLTLGSYTVIRGAKISYAMVYQTLVDNHLEITFYCAHLGFLPDDCVDYYLEMSRKQHITDSNAYMKSIIWTKIKEAGSTNIANLGL